MTTATAGLPNLLAPDVRDDVFYQKVTRVPFVARVKWGRAASELHTMTYRAQAARTSNAQSETYTYSSPTHSDGTPATMPTVIQTKEAELSRRMQTRTIIGIEDAFAEQQDLAQSELGTDMEYMAWNGDGSTTEPQQVRGIIGGIGYFNATGSLPTGYQVTTVDGTGGGVGILPSHIRSAQLAARDKGGAWNTLWIPPEAKEDLRAHRNISSEARTTVPESSRTYSEGVDYWEGTFGDFESVMSDDIGSSNAFGCDMDCFEAAFLDGLQWWNVTATGLHRKGFWYHEWALYWFYPWYCAHFSTFTR